MRITGLFIAPVAIVLMVLSGCATGSETATKGAVSNTAPSASSSSSPTPKPIPIPDDALLVMTAKATAANGSVMDLRLVVLESRAWNDAGGAPRAAATSAWCEGELDETVYGPGNYGFAEADYSAKLSGSEIAWPADLLVRLLPSPGEGVSVTAAGAAYQIEPPDPNSGDDPGYYVPHCQQPAYLGGPGSGIVYLGFGGDTAATPPFSSWSQLSYGWTFDPIDSSIDPSKVTITDCTLSVTALGKSLGATVDGGTGVSGTFCGLGVIG